MDRYRSGSRLAIYICLFCGIVPAKCGQYAAFMTSYGSQLVVLDTSANLTYSLCNSGSTPVYPTDSTPVLPVSSGPRSGSNIAAVGYYEDDIVYADIFWQDSSFSIQHGRYKCDMDDGTYSLVLHESPDSELSSNSDMPDVNIFTGLAAVRLESTNEIRLFFHDTDSGLHQIEYTSSGGWEYVGSVNPDGHLQGPSVGAAVIDGTEEIYTVLPRSDKNIDIASASDGSVWDVESTPRSLTNSDTSGTSTQNFTVNATQIVFAILEAWDSGISNLGLAIDKAESKYIFYIGSDKGLRYVASVKDTNFGGWSIYNSLDTEYWPLADEADGDFAVASDPSSYEIRIYYMSSGSMTEVSRIGEDAWAEASALPTKATTTHSQASTTATASSDQSSSSSSGDPATTVPVTNPSDKDSGGLSTAAAAGVGVAATIAALILAGVIGGWYWRRKTKSHKNRRAQDEVPLSLQLAGPFSYFGNEGVKMYGHFADAKRQSTIADDQGLPKDMMVGDIGATTAAGHGPTGAIPNTLDMETSSSTKFVYVPAYELPTYPKHSRSKSELPGSPVTPLSPSELPSPGLPVRVPRSIYNQRQTVTGRSSTTISSPTAGIRNSNNVEANGRISDIQGPMSPLTDPGVDPGPNNSRHGA